MTEIFATAAACAGALIVAGPGIAVLPWTEREHLAVLRAFRLAAIATRMAFRLAPIATRMAFRLAPIAPRMALGALVHGSVKRPSDLLLSRRSPPGVLPWNSSFPPFELTGSALRKPSIASSPGTAAT